MVCPSTSRGLIRKIRRKITTTRGGTLMITNLTDRRSERGMTLFAVMAVMTISAMLLLAAAPMVRQDVTREKEIEAVYRGEEVAEAIRQYVEFYRGAKLPTSM